MAGPAPAASPPASLLPPRAPPNRPSSLLLKIKPAPVTSILLQLPLDSVATRLLGVELGHLLHVDADALAVEEEEVDILQRGRARVVEVGRDGFEGHLGGCLFGEAVSVPTEKNSLCHFGRRDPRSGTGPQFLIARGLTTCRLDHV